MIYNVYYWIEKNNANENKIKENNEILEKTEEIIKILFNNSQEIIDSYRSYIEEHKDYIFRRETITIPYLTNNPEQELLKILKTKYDTDKIKISLYFPLININPN
jgi:hypothetical protein